MVSEYETFKAEAKRLVSVKCDRCGVECWKAPGQKIVRARIDPGTYLAHSDFHGSGNYWELCVSCGQELQAVVLGWLFGRRGFVMPGKDAHETESLREQRDNLARALDVIASEDGRTIRASWLIGVARNALHNLDIDLRFGADCCGGDGCCDPENCSRKKVAVEA